jgi:hypothetical protein
MSNIFIRFLEDPTKDQVYRWQWGRFKRREQSFWFIVSVIAFFNVITWLLWALFVAPYPQALNVPGLVETHLLAAVWDYMWPLFVSLILAVNVVLAHYIYKKDIFVAWITLGLSFLLQMIVLAIVVSLAIILLV